MDYLIFLPLLFLLGLLGVVIRFWYQQRIPDRPEEAENEGPEAMDRSEEEGEEVPGHPTQKMGKKKAERIRRKEERRQYHEVNSIILVQNLSLVKSSGNELNRKIDGYVKSCVRKNIKNVKKPRKKSGKRRYEFQRNFPANYSGNRKRKGK